MSTTNLALAGTRVGAALLCIWLALTQSPTARDLSQSASMCPPAHAKLDGELHSRVDARSGSHERVILRVRPGYERRYRDILERHGDHVAAEFPSIGALAVEIHGPDVDSLVFDPAVEGILVDAPVHASDDDSSGSTLRGLEGLRETLGLTSSWTGSGIGIALIDSGLQPTKDFETRVRAFYDFTRGGVQSIADDAFGHGTHVSGLAAGDGTLSNSNEFMGIAPKARLVILRVLDQNGQGYTSHVISALEFAIKNKAALGIDIVNLSLGHPIYEPAASDPLVLAVEKAVRAGIVVVVAAGNYGKSPENGLAGYAGITSPGNAPSAITVGAVDTRGTVSRMDDRLPSYSSRGPTWYDAYAKPDLVAPGHDLGAAAATNSWLYATYPTLRLQSNDEWNYMRLSGTSMAAAVTSGVIAHMLEANANTNGRRAPRLTPNAVKAVLQYTAIGVRDDATVVWGTSLIGAIDPASKTVVWGPDAITAQTHPEQAWPPERRRVRANEAARGRRRRHPVRSPLPVPPRADCSTPPRELGWLRVSRRVTRR